MRARAGAYGAGGKDDEGVGEHGFFEHGLARIERMFFCDGVAKLRGNPWDPCSRGIIELLKIIVKVVIKTMIRI